MHVEFDVVLMQDESGEWIARVPSLAGCVSSGTTRDEALANVREAITLCRRHESPRDIQFARVAVD